MARQAGPCGKPEAAEAEAGSATIELALCAPLLVMLLLLAVLVGRVAQARLEVDGAARDAARAASLARDPLSAASAARQTAAATLGQRQVTCRSLRVAVEIGAFRAGGSVAVQVACTIEVADLILLRLPGSRTITSRFVEPLDVFRATR